jgi:hypothetical protein
LDRSYSLHQRAIALFGFQVAILSPAAPHLESKARVLAAVKILEKLEDGMALNVDLEQRLKIAGYRETLDLIMREGGPRQLRSLWTTRVLWEDTGARLQDARDLPAWSSSLTGSQSLVNPRDAKEGARPWLAILFAK